MTRPLQLMAAALVSLLVLAFQFQLLPFFSPLFTNDQHFWPIVYYGSGALVIGLTLTILARQVPILRRSLPALCMCAFAAGLTIMHPIDVISKNYLVATIFVACTIVLAIASAPLALLRFSASVTTLSAVICLLDILFSRGFTNTLGRAAGLSINANVAAGGLLLGAASSHWAVPQQWRGPFVLTVAAAIFATLSKSTLLAAIIIAAVVAADQLRTRLRLPRPRPPPRWFGPVAAALVLAGWIAAALFANDRFALAVRLSFQGLNGALTAFEQARQSIASAVEIKPVLQTGRPKSSNDNVGPKPQSDETNLDRERRTEETDRRDALIKEIGRRVETEGDINSISARGLLMERAFLSYRYGPFFGQGLAAAYALQPHNTFLLFAIAFGHIGWLLPLSFLGLTLYWVRRIQELPLFLATLTVMTTSHDILHTPGMLAPIVLGLAGLNALRYRDCDNPSAASAPKYTAVIAPVSFALGSVCMADTGLSKAQAVPNLLLLLVFGAIALWSIAIWLSPERPIHAVNADAPTPGVDETRNDRRSR
jgi:hypothetical protein